MEAYRRVLKVVRRWLLIVGCCLVAESAQSLGLTASRLGIIYAVDGHNSREVALSYAAQRGVPLANVIGLTIPAVNVLTPSQLGALRTQMLQSLPTSVQSLLLVWSKPYAAGCMSVTTAFAAGYQEEFCEPGCAKTLASSLFDSDGWLPADTVGWLPAMLLPSDDRQLADDLISRGKASDFSNPTGTVYLIRTDDRKRNVRAAAFADVESALGNRFRVVERRVPVTGDVQDAIGYFTGVERVEELPRIHFRAGALADHLTSSGGVPDGRGQMPALAWLRQGATASYGTVSEPCAYPEKFPNIEVLLEHYRHGETALEAYWKSVAMPGQGLFLGEPLARPYASH